MLEPTTQQLKKPTTRVSVEIEGSKNEENAQRSSLWISFSSGKNHQANRELYSALRMRFLLSNAKGELKLSTNQIKLFRNTVEKLS
jgi:hypothetical protein